MRALVAIASIVAAVVLAACDGGGDGQPGNVFQNPGFEGGRDPWFSLRPPDFILSEEQANSGGSSALLVMRAGPEDEGAKVFYLVQEVNPEEFPEVVSGHYRVTKWERGTDLQYLQFVVIAIGADNLPGRPPTYPDPFPNHQIRYPLAGIDREPFQIANAHFIFLSREDPPLDQWVPFSVNVKEDFQRLWGAAPEGYETIRILFEVRYDSKAIGEGPLAADVYYDDLYFGPAP